MKKTIFEKMTESFQCPGCVCGKDIKCGAYKQHPTIRSCSGHVLGTMIMGLGSFALGLPKGFCRPGYNYGDTRGANKMEIRFYDVGGNPQFDRFNVPVWALEQDGYLFVRTYMPRLNNGAVDIVKSGKRSELCPQALDVAEFIDEID